MRYNPYNWRGGCKLVIEFTDPSDLKKLKDNTFEDAEDDETKSL